MRQNATFVFLMVLIATSISYGQQTQQRKRARPAQPATPAVQAPIEPVMSFSENELTARLGFASTAVHLGASYNKMSEGLGWGGYFFFQTEKSSAGIPQLISFGGNLKINFFENQKVVVYAAPGFGVHMLKQTAGNTSSSETLIGPSTQLGFQWRLKSDLAIGLERGAVGNWFNDKVGSSELATYSAVATFNF